MWLIACAIPVQGLAATTMLGCGQGHRHPAGGHSSVASKSPSSLSEVAHGADATGHSSEGSQLRKVADHKCSNCSTCSVAPGLLPTAPELRLLQASYHFGPVVLELPVAFWSDSPERPPRSAAG